MVEWKPIEDLGPYFGGLTGKTKDDFVDGNAKFITYMNVFTNPSLDVSTTGVVRINKGERQNRIQKGDILFTGSSETPEEAGMSCVVTDELNDDYYMNSFCFGIRLNQPEQYNLGYLKHILRSFNIRKEIAKSASGVTRFNISKARFGKIRIPIPSLSEQQRVVDILDTFTSSIENLKEQIALRRKQYEYYRDQLLDIEGKDGVEWKSIDEIKRSLKTGLNPRQNFKLNTSTAEFPYITGKDIYNNQINISDNTDKIDAAAISIINKRACLEKGLLLFASTGCGTVGRMAIIKDYNHDWAISETLYAIKFISDILPDYVMQCLYANYIKKQYEPKISRGSVPHLKVADLLKVNIPIPSIIEQQRIVSILDTFEASIANLEAQLAQREKQYEYYRNKLLTFE